MCLIQGASTVPRIQESVYPSILNQIRKLMVTRMGKPEEVTLQ